MNTDRDIASLLKRGVAEVIVRQEMEELLRSGKKLRLKEGFDPSFPDIHLGHTVGLRKLRQFQELGHQVVLIVGDWTAQIGDPSGVSITRPMLTAEQVKANAETYMQQFFKIVDKNRTEVAWQSQWFGKFTLGDVIQLTSKFTVAQLLAREDFSSRYNAGRPIAVTELLYPLLQAYDSVMVRADVEFGGTDQRFNLLLGRELQSIVGQRPQQCLMTPLLIGTDGTQKMSKSLGNYIGVAEPPAEIYGKVMSINDNLIMDYFELLTDVPEEELARFRRDLENDDVNPMTLKKRLAGEIVTLLYDKKSATGAQGHFEKVHEKREMPEEIPEFRFSFAKMPSRWRKEDGRDIRILGQDDWNLDDMLIKIGFARSRSEASRLIRQGAVSVNGKKITNVIAHIENGSIIKVGKRRFAKVVNTDIEPRQGI
ncbi:MAG: tyrosine--tRNA ligase [Dehalococcoidales bacterium]|nr:tyrosine--tRNA ligase [Dehalococcoidales bacterium]